MSAKRYIKKTLGWLAAALFVLAGSAALYAYLHQDKIIALFVDGLNKHLQAKVQVAKIEVKWWKNFPNVTIELERAVIFETGSDTAKLADAGAIQFTFNAWNAWQGRYIVNSLEITDARISCKINADGKANYNIFKTDSTPKNEALAFDISEIKISNTAFKFTNQQTHQLYRAHLQQIVCGLHVQQQQLQITAAGQLFLHIIQAGEDSYLVNKALKINLALLHSQQDQVLTITKSDIGIDKALFSLTGSVKLEPQTYFNLILQGKNTSIQHIVSLLPAKYTQRARAYKSKGNVYFYATLKGSWSARSAPLITATFGCRNGIFYHPEYEQTLQNVRFTGYFTNGNRQSAESTELTLKQVSGSLGGKPFSADIHFRNFADPEVDTRLEASLNLEQLLAFYPVKQIPQAAGQAKVKVAFTGKLAELKRNPGSTAIKLSGELIVKGAQIKFQSFGLPFNQLNGRLQIARNDFAIQNLSGRVGHSDFVLNGYFRKAIAWLLQQQKQLALEADLDCNYLDVDELLSQQTKPVTASVKSVANTSSEYTLAISPNFTCRLQTTINRLNFRRLQARAITGEVLVQHQVLSTPGLNLQAMGGSLNLRGTIDARNPKLTKIVTISRLQHLYLDSAFYVFENFNQEFLQHRHLRGQVNAGVVADIYLNEKLEPQPQLLEADIMATLSNGQLLDFEPLQRLSKFIDKEELRNLHFDEISNHIQIYDRAVHIPELEIKTSLSTIPQLSFFGVHQFDEHFEYHLKIPLARMLKGKKTAQPAAENQEKSANLFLTIKGTPERYKITYDTERVIEKLRSDMKKEGEELREAIKGQKKAQKAAELNEQEFFDFH